MTRITETAKKYDRSLVAVATTIGTILTVYLATGSKLNALVENSKCFQKLDAKVEQNKAVQDEVNKQILEYMKETREDVKTLLMRNRR